MSAVETEGAGQRNLPPRWSWVSLGEVCDAVNGRAFKSTEWRESGIPIIRIQNLKDASAPFNYFQGELDDKHRVKAGDLLFAWSGTPGTSFGAHIWEGPDAALNQHIFNVRFDRTRFDTKYFCFALNQNVARYVSQAQGGVGLAHITKSRFMASEVPIAPLEEQRRLVAELETQFSRLDEAVANLNRVKANLKRYKAAVLKAAVEGRLVETEAELARREGRSYETGQVLLENVLDERRKNWVGPRRYKEPTPPGLTAPPRLPQGWAWATLEQIAYLDIGFAFKSADFSSTGIRLLRGENIEPGRLRWDDTRYWPAERLASFEPLLIQEGDIILAMDRPVVSAGLKLARATAADLPCLLVQRMARIRCVGGISGQYLFTVMSTPRFERHLLQGQTGTQLPHVSGRSIGQFAVPLPPHTEQVRIVAEIERRLSIIAEAENRATANISRAHKSRSSILHRAFAG